jgi:hypothetical protein
MIFIDSPHPRQAVVIVLPIIPSPTSCGNQKCKDIVEEYRHEDVCKDKESENTIVAISTLFLIEMLVCSKLDSDNADGPKDEEEKREEKYPNRCAINRFTLAYKCP